MIRTIICDLFEIEYPVFQGGMAHLGTAELVSAVSNAGGLGFIGSGSNPPEWLRDQIRKTRERTQKPFGVNVIMISPHLKASLEVIQEEKVKIVAFGGGNPGVYIPPLKEAGVKVVPVISSVALAKRLERLGADAIVAEGMESGGHVGETTTMALVPQVVDSVSIPVVAAGGFGDGRGLAAALCLGAKGIQMGTRFICTPECIAHQKFKEAIVKARDRATVVTGTTTGHPARCLENHLTREYQALERSGAPKEALDKFATGRMYTGVIQGDVENGSLMCGQIAGLIKDIRPAKNIVEEEVVQAEAILKQIVTTLMVSKR
ncbi:MAG: nitronate monooxygenase [Dehalococcoidia bacterium]|nr:nitronate monooxygenase [Dehalococcoidia bacterium]